MAPLVERSPSALSVRRFASRQAMGDAAAADIGADLRARLKIQERVGVMFAAAPSQSEMHSALVKQSGIDWRRVVAFHMDEYIGLPAASPQRFGSWLRASLFDHLPLGAAHFIEADGDPRQAAAKYAALLASIPVDIVCLGIGVNGHLAFNDPPVADFRDPQAVKVVCLDETARQQQVDDGCFAAIDAVPTSAITVTIPWLMSADRLFCVVPGRAKRQAVRRTLRDPIGPACPATVLRLHPRCTLYLDADSAADGA
jgi:glucosamine-6-phosphate deaminase